MKDLLALQCNWYCENRGSWNGAKKDYAISRNTMELLCLAPNQSRQTFHAWDDSDFRHASHQLSCTKLKQKIQFCLRLTEKYKFHSPISQNLCCIQLFKSYSAARKVASPHSFIISIQKKWTKTWMKSECKFWLCYRFKKCPSLQ